MLHPTPSKRPLDAQQQMEPRKVRKGTQSCWECKRRKIRCRFANPQDAVCIPCASRALVCVGQQFPDAGRNTQLGDRLTRVEALIAQVLETLHSSPDKPAIHSSGHDAEPLQHMLARDPDAVSSPTSNLRHASSDSSPAVQHHVQRSQSPHEPSGEQHRHVSHELLDAFPDQKTLGLLSRLPLALPSSLHGLPSLNCPEKDQATLLRDILHTPTSSGRVVEAAKQLLLLSLILQSLSQRAVAHMDSCGVDCYALASRLVEVAHRTLLAGEEPFHCIDGVECLYMESIYLNNAGDLRKSWLILRQAMSLAQFLGLHRKASSTTSDLTSRELWHSMIITDRYLSLLLGMSQAAFDDADFVSSRALAECKPIERLLRLDCVAAGRLIQRTQSGVDSSSLTHEIDALLQSAAASLPAQWWLVPTFTPEDDNTAKGEENIMRVMFQLAHFHLVARLHLPYLLRPTADSRHESHKAITVNASRELLLRYVAFRSLGASNHYCGGADYLMFIASTTLTLAHIHSSHRTDSASNGLLHQRLGDRGLMERALECLNKTDRRKCLEIYSQIATTLQHLLNSEAEAAQGAAIFNFSSSETSRTQSGPDCGGELDSRSNTLTIFIPWIGVIKLERDRVSSFLPSEPLTTNPQRRAMSSEAQRVPHYLADTANVQADNQAALGFLEFGTSSDTQDWPFQGVDTALFEDLFPTWIPDDQRSS